MKSGFFTRRRRLTEGLDYPSQTLRNKIFLNGKQYLACDSIEAGPMRAELFKKGQTINANICCNEPYKLNEAFMEKWPALAKNKGIVVQWWRNKR